MIKCNILSEVCTIEHGVWSCSNPEVEALVTQYQNRFNDRQNTPANPGGNYMAALQMIAEFPDGRIISINNEPISRVDPRLKV